MKTFSYEGVTLSAKEWAARLGISRDAFYQRVEDFKDKDAIFRYGHIRKPNNWKNQLHGKSTSRSYQSWADMHKRCGPTSRKKHRYYDRGITVCKRWRLFTNFLKDMGERPHGHTLDRKNNNKGYYKANCRWATPKQQARNTSTNHLVWYKNKNIPLVQLAEQENINYGVLRQRLHRGLSLEKALTKNRLPWGSTNELD